MLLCFHYYMFLELLHHFSGLCNFAFLSNNGHELLLGCKANDISLERKCFLVSFLSISSSWLFEHSDQLSNLPPVMTNWAISPPPQQQRINSSERRQQTEVDGCFVYSMQSFDRLKFFYMSIQKNYEKSFFFAKFCIGDHSLIEESDLPGLVL